MVNSFEMIKEAITNATILAYPDDTKKFPIATDPSDYGLGAWIGQKEEKMRIIAFDFRTLSPARRRYSATKKELLAVIWA